MRRSPRRILIPTPSAAMSAATLLAAVAICGSTARHPANAETLAAPRARQGYYFAVGPSFFETTQWGAARSHGAKPGLLLSYGLGQMLTNRWGLGFRIEEGMAHDDGKTFGTFGLGLEAQVNPWRNFALHLGVGAGVNSLSDPRDRENPTRVGYGSVYSVGASWDLFFTHRLTGGWSIEPTVMVRYLPTDSLNGLSLSGGIQLVNWSGRPRNQLALPDSEAYREP
jgi:hypothetical protein